MAGYYIDGCHLDDTPQELVGAFHIDHGDSAQRIRAFTRGPVLTLQVDGDELDAVLWGLQNYKKP
jgi:hypothetical protein